MAVWHKHASNPILGGDLGTCFDLCVLREQGVYKMWFSWRPKDSIALVQSEDGVHWTAPVVVLEPLGTESEIRVNRACVLHTAGGYLMWYTSQSRDESCICMARSSDGIAWTRASQLPVLQPSEPWEGKALMCPHVIWDEQIGLLTMWYSGGEQFEPDAIGHATSPDGLRWTRTQTMPVFRPERQNQWESHKVTACQVVRMGEWHLMFYIGFSDRDHAQIGVARSRDGVSDWERHPANPIISPDVESWDADACYKPFAIYDEREDLWRLWYNGRRGMVEQIGLATHKGKDLGF